MTITLYDAIYVQNLKPPPPGADGFAGYIDGHWADYAAIVAAYPKAPVLSIAVFSTSNADALDVENGDATVEQIYAWFKRQLARGVVRPCIYSSVLNVNHIVATMTANGFARATYRLWSAHYGAGAHICGPTTCRLTQTACDATQWTDEAEGGRADESLALDDFFGAIPKPPTPKPTPKEDEMPYGMLLPNVTGPQPASWPAGNYTGVTIIATPPGVTVKLAVHHESSNGWWEDPAELVIPAGGGQQSYTFGTAADVNGISLEVVSGTALVSWHATG